MKYTQVIDKWAFWNAKLKATSTLTYVLTFVNGTLSRVFNQVPVTVGNGKYYTSFNSINENSEVFQFFKTKYLTQCIQA